MKKGTASRGKLSTPPTILCTRVSGGMVPENQIYIREPMHIAIAIGIPKDMEERKERKSRAFIG
jgi:hypothetical protein